jgi:hypothetical protein
VRWEGARRQARYIYMEGRKKKKAWQGKEAKELGSRLAAVARGGCTCGLGSSERAGGT